jgi:hypothetical protein
MGITMKAFHSYAIIAVGLVVLVYRDRIVNRLVAARSDWIDAMFGGPKKISKYDRDKYTKKLCLIIGIALIVGGLVTLF